MHFELFVLVVCILLICFIVVIVMNHQHYAFSVQQLLAGAASGPPDLVDTAITEWGLSVEVCDSQGFTPLIVACRYVQCQMPWFTLIWPFSLL